MLKFKVNFTKIRRIRGPRTKIEEMLKFRDPINLIKDVIEKKIWNLDLIWPKIKELKDQESQ